jgi:hypothetical protein
VLPVHHLADKHSQPYEDIVATNVRF